MSAKNDLPCKGHMTTFRMCWWIWYLFHSIYFYFLPQQEDVFTVTCIDLGKLQKVTLGHDLVGRGQGWYCEEVVVKVAELEETVFPCNR